MRLLFYNFEFFVKNLNQLLIKLFFRNRKVNIYISAGLNVKTKTNFSIISLVRS